MPSRLASALINLPGKSGEVADVLWRNASLNESEHPLAVPSPRVVSELVQLTDGKTTTDIVSKLPNRESLDVVMSSKQSAAARDGIVINPIASRAHLEAVVNAGGNAAIAASSRLAATIDNVLAGDSFDLMILDTIEDQGRIQEWAKNVIGNGQSATAEMFRKLIVACPRRADLLNLMAVENGVVIDVLMADRILNGASITADTAKLSLEAALGKTRDPNRIATPAALRLLQESDLVVPAQRGGSKTGTDASMAMTLKAAGMSDAEIAPLLLGNDGTTLPDGFLIGVLKNCSDGLVSQFLGGQSARSPRPGEALALLRNVGSDRAANLATMFSEALESTPWAAELLVGTPCRNLDKLGFGALAELDALLTREIGENPASWEFVCVMSEEWEQTLDTLLQAASQMTTLQ